MSVRVGSAINGVAAELIPAIAAFGYGLYREKTIFVVLGMFILVYAAGFRALKQYKYANLLQSICTKLIEHESSEDAV
jgi:hypothetical protein